MLNLGTVTLQAVEVTSLSAEEGDEYAEHAVIKGPPVLQYIGPKLASLSIGVLFDAEMGVNPVSRKEALEELRGQAFYVSTASGRQLGRFVLATLTQTERRLTGAGSVLSLALQLELTEDAGELTVEMRRREVQTTAPARRVSDDYAGDIR